MGLDLSENGMGFGQLIWHIGHKIVCVPYGDAKDPVNVALECEDCGVVLLDFNHPDVEEI